MANSTTNLDTISSGVVSPEITANQFFDAASPASAFGRRGSQTNLLTWAYYGGTIWKNGVKTQIANGTITLTASTVHYIELDINAGTVSKNVTGFTAGRIPLYSVDVGSATVNSYTDYRMVNPKFTGRLAKAMTDANQTLTQEEAANDILGFTGTLTAQRNIVVPLNPQQWTVYNGTTGGFGLQFIGASGTGIVVAATKRAILYSDGTNVVRVTGDT